MTQKRRAEKSPSTRKIPRLEVDAEEAVPAKQSSPSSGGSKKKSKKNEDRETRFIGKAVPDEESRERWPHRFSPKAKNVGTAANRSTENDDENAIVPARRHYLQAEVDGVVYHVSEDAHVKAGDNEDPYICRIVEMFEDFEGQPFFTAQWFYRAKDTVITIHGDLIDDKRIFLSEIKNDNPLDCLVKKIKIVRLPANADLKSIPVCDYYYDMMYLLPYSTYVVPPAEGAESGEETSSTISSDSDAVATKPEMTLLDLYCGCGAMSSGLCIGANAGGLNLVTKWAIDLNSYACESLKLNHPETHVRNESADDFLSLLKEWEKLCVEFNAAKSNQTYEEEDGDGEEDDDDSEEDEINGGGDGEIFEVEKVRSICYGDPNNEKNGKGLYLRVRWKGYGPSEDSWEPVSGLGNCREAIGEFVRNSCASRLLPLPGDVDMICGGPPCQGISGFNRFRNKENPLDDEKNRQLIVFMDFVRHLKPKYVLMENVVDILKFSGGFLGRYALGRLVSMNYQARMGMLVAGAYGLPQFRNRVFIWGAVPTAAAKLPQYPLPTHDVVLRGSFAMEFERNGVAYEEGHAVILEEKLRLGDAISDLPPVTNDEERDEMVCKSNSWKTEFQRLIRMSKEGEEEESHVLFDHRPLKLNDDDYQRVCRIPKKKGANFRDLPGVRVRADNHVEWDPDVERVLLPSGKPLVPDYAMTFVRGTSSKPFGRLWWDETVATVVTRAEPHNQVILHPDQDRVLTVRENARLQGFPDYYKLCGPVKQRYVQVGNAVAFPVSRALGYSLAMTCRGLSDDQPLFTLPPRFPDVTSHLPSVSSDDPLAAA